MSISLIKYRDAEANCYIYFWIDSKTNKACSPTFYSQDEAESWLSSVSTAQDITKRAIEKAMITSRNYDGRK